MIIARFARSASFLQSLDDPKTRTRNPKCLRVLAKALGERERKEETRDRSYIVFAARESGFVIYKWNAFRDFQRAEKAISREWVK